jgi:tetratricopeptide (TPR) repeat protein
MATRRDLLRCGGILTVCFSLVEQVNCGFAKKRSQAMKTVALDEVDTFLAIRHGTTVAMRAAGDVMKLKVSAACFSLLLAAVSSLTAQEINPEVVRLNKIANERQGARDWPSAERHYLHALDIATKSEAGHTVATLNQNLGNLYAAENRYTEAEKQYRLSYNVLKAEYGEQNPKVALALNMIGEMICFEGRFKPAARCFNVQLTFSNHRRVRATPRLPPSSQTLRLLSGFSEICPRRKRFWVS